MPPKPRKPWGLKSLQQFKEKMPNLNEFAENSKKYIQKQYQNIRQKSFEDRKQELKEKAKKLSQYNQKISERGSEQLNKLYQKSGKFAQESKAELSKGLQSKKKDAQKYINSIYEKQRKNIPFLNKPNSNPQKQMPAENQQRSQQKTKNELSKGAVDKQTKDEKKQGEDRPPSQKKSEDGYLNFKNYSWSNISSPVQRITQSVLNQAQKIKSQSSQKFKSFSFKETFLEIFNKIYWKLIFGFCLVAFIYGIASQIPRQIRIYFRDTMSHAKKNLGKNKQQDD